MNEQEKREGMSVVVFVLALMAAIVTLALCCSEAPQL